jgi:hypothetical protein
MLSSTPHALKSRGPNIHVRSISISNESPFSFVTAVLPLILSSTRPLHHHLLRAMLPMAYYAACCLMHCRLLLRRYLWVLVAVSMDVCHCWFLAKGQEKGARCPTSLRARQWRRQQGRAGAMAIPMMQNFLKHPLKLWNNLWSWAST